MSLNPEFLMTLPADVSAAGSLSEPWELWRRLLFVAACLVLPVIWGVVVNWLFDFWQKRTLEIDDARIFPDYQI